MSISYTVQIPHEPRSDQLIQKTSAYDKFIKSNEEAEKSYPWPGHHELNGYVPHFHENPDDSASDMSVKPFDVRNADADRNALSADGYEVSPSMRSNPTKLFYMPQPPFRLPHRRRHGRHRHRHRLAGYHPRPERLSLASPTSRSSDLGVLVLPSGGPRQLTEDIRNQLEDDQLLRKAAKQAFNNDEGNMNYIRVVCYWGELNRFNLCWFWFTYCCKKYFNKCLIPEQPDKNLNGATSMGFNGFLIQTTIISVVDRQLIHANVIFIIYNLKRPFSNLPFSKLCISIIFNLS